MSEKATAGPVGSANSEVVNPSMKLPHTLLLALSLLLLALPSAHAQSEPLPPQAAFPTDLRLVRGTPPALRWTSTGDASWSIERSTDLQVWQPLRFFETTNAPGKPVTLDPALGVALLGAGPGVRYHRLVHRAALPVILTPPVDQIIQEGVPFKLIAQVDGDLPLISRWYHGDTLLATQTNQHYAVVQHQLLEDGDYHLEVVNPWGSVTSPVVHAVIGPRQAYTTKSLAGRTVEMNMQVAGAPLVTPVRFRLKFAATGYGCELEGIENTPSATGGYGYPAELIRPTSARVDWFFRDSFGKVLPVSAVAYLDFRSATHGTFQFSAEMPVLHTGTGEFHFVE